MLPADGIQTKAANGTALWTADPPPLQRWAGDRSQPAYPHPSNWLKNSNSLDL